MNVYVKKKISHLYLLWENVNTSFNEVMNMSQGQQ